MSRCVTQIHEAAFREQDNEIVSVIASENLVDLRFDLFPTPVIPHELRVDFGVEMTNIANDRMPGDRAK
jgi:hypothetical protein